MPNNMLAPIGSFHPELERQFVTDEHYQIVENFRKKYMVKSVEAIEEPEASIYHDEESGSALRYYVTHPDSMEGIDEESAIVTAHPFANRISPHMALRQKAISEITHMPVITFPNNFGSSENERFSLTTRHQIKRLGYHAITNLRSRAIAQEFGYDKRFYALGWSEGGTFAASYASTMSNQVDIPAVGAYDPPNVMTRSRTALLKDSIKLGGKESFSDAARRADVGALSAAMNIDAPNNAMVDAAKVKYFVDMLSGGNLARVKSFRFNTVEADLRTYLENTEHGHADLFIGKESTVAPERAVVPIALRLQRRFGSRVCYLALAGAGHAESDQIFDLAIMAAHTTRSND